MKSQTRGGRSSIRGQQPGQRGQDDVESEWGEDERTQKDATGGAGSRDSGGFGASRGDAFIDRDLQEIEEEDDSLLAGGRHDVESESQGSGKSAPGSGGKSRR